MSAAARGGSYYPLGSLTGLSPAAASLAATSKRGLDPGRLEKPVVTVPGVGAATDRKLRALGISTVRDLLMHLPFRHEPPSRIANVAELCLGEELTLRARVVSCAVRETARRRVKVLEALMSDETGSVVATWYNQAYLEGAFRERPEVLLRGVLMRKRGGSTFIVKRHEILDSGEESRHILGLVPVYPSAGDLSVRTIRTLLHRAARHLSNMLDPLPAELLARKGYAGRAEAVWASHFPSSVAEGEAARARLVFEELLLLQIAVLRQRAAVAATQAARPLSGPSDLTRRFIQSLPYEPTGAQKRVIAEIDQDLARGVPMRRLLHGDVGSGKTMVAVYSLLRAVEQGAQGALLAPTEVLVEQHYIGLCAQLQAFGVRVGLLKGSQAPAERRTVRRSLESGGVDVIVGTHALIHEDVRFRDLRVAVVDEQHRFGVRQRDAILAGEPTDYWPHSLHMSATPIPRTLSLTLYGDLDVSVLDELPTGRRPVITRLVSAGSETAMWEFVRHKLGEGQRAYVVCPLIEESDNLAAASALQTYTELKGGELAAFQTRLLHGQLGSVDKQSAMAAFACGEAQVLVSTSVIEVGVDVPMATVMIVMGARRFGLSQLHQLRGRVGRGDRQAYCFLLAEGEEGAALDRLELFAKTTDGFKLAEADLLARGAGQLFGERQSGVGDLEVASLPRDRAMLEEARREAETFMDVYRGDEQSALLRPTAVESAARFADKVEWIKRA
jgi:ATP-dependent DNA helicase RecG